MPKGTPRPTGGVDAGIVTTGLAVVYGGKVVDAHEIRGERGLTKVRATERAQRVLEVSVRIAGEAREWFAQYSPAEIGVESYEWQGEDRGNIAHAWMVSMLIGAFAAELSTVAPLVVQRSVDVKHPTIGYGQILDAWKGGRRGIVPGDEIATNEHKRDAVLHALWCETTNWQRVAA